MGKALYTAFDRFPSRKGAATHIARFAPALFERCGGGLLYVQGDEGMPLRQFEGDVEIQRHVSTDFNLLSRALDYSDLLGALLDDRGTDFALCQFRDPWGGVPLLRRRPRGPTVYEVNALPSIELATRYPALPTRTLEKLHAHERFCLDRCSHIVTPSETTRRLLVDLGVVPDRVSVVPNGADLPSLPVARPSDAPEHYLIYFGALQAWQGVDTLLRAFARLADIDALRLVICASQDNRDARRLRRLAERLGIESRLQWHFALDPDRLQGWLAHARLSIAPLADCARNVVQGCAPLKILEAMAAGVATIASDLPAVRELLRDGIDGCLVPADRPAALARVIRVALAYPERTAILGRRARERIAEGWTWGHSLSRLDRVYDVLGVRREPHPATATAG